MPSDRMKAFVVVLAILAANIVGYELGYSSGHEDGISYQTRVDLDNIVLGLIKLPSGYYIVNNNYGNFKVNTTNQIEAVKRLSEEISPCV